MHMEFVENVKDYISEEFLGIETYGIGDPTPFFSEEITSTDELVDATIKSIISSDNGYFELTISVEGKGERTFKIMKGTSLRMSMLLPKTCPGAYTEHVIVEIIDVSETEVSMKVVYIEAEVEDYEDDLQQPVINLPHTYIVDEKYEYGTESPFYYQPKEITFDAYTKLSSVSKKENGKFNIVISCGEDEDSLQDYEYEVSEGTILNLNICELNGGWVYGHAVLDCKVKVSDLSENKVTLTLLEEGEENLDK